MYWFVHIAAALKSNVWVVSCPCWQIKLQRDAEQQNFAPLLVCFLLGCGSKCMQRPQHRPITVSRLVPFSKVEIGWFGVSHLREADGEQWKYSADRMERIAFLVSLLVLGWSQTLQGLPVLPDPLYPTQDNFDLDKVRKWALEFYFFKILNVWYWENVKKNTLVCER